ncbi:MAG: S8/S53 family peptidase [Gemmatimonadaceae bacterium]|nr:S8/S53 family peptidase [Gemmatimonadaceae bacterium]
MISRSVPVVKIALIDTAICSCLGISPSVWRSSKVEAASDATRPVLPACGQNIHGSLCATIILAIGIEVEFLIFEIVDPQGETTTEDLTVAIEAAIAQEADIINVSIGTGSMRGIGALARACKRAAERHIPLVAAMGSTEHPFAPAVFADCISVEMRMSADSFSLGTPSSPYGDISACGSFSFSCSHRASPLNSRGSSFSAAVVSGWIARAIALGTWNKTWSQEEMIGHLIDQSNSNASLPETCSALSSARPCITFPTKAL